MKKFQFIAICCLVTALAWSCGTRNDILEDGSLPRAEASPRLTDAIEDFLSQMKTDSVHLHSVMVLQHGKVTYEKWFGEESAQKPHALWSVSKTFTAAAVGFAEAEGLLKLTDKVIDFFPEDLPDTVSDNLAAMTVRDLLTMNCGHDTEPYPGQFISAIRGSAEDAPQNWSRIFLAHPVIHKPGTYYCYNSLGSYMLSAIVSKVTGEKELDYLRPRLFEPLQISDPTWEESPEGYNTGGWGLSLKTEDLAKMGLLMLHNGVWNGSQLLPKGWVEEASIFQVPSASSGMSQDEVTDEDRAVNDWVQGYGYQMWRCRNNAYRADGAGGQFILVMPDKDAVVALTAWTSNTQKELNLVWDHLLPVL